MTARVKVPDLTGLQFTAKAGNFHGQCDVLRSRGLIERVAARCSPATAALVREPPAVTTWLGGETVIELYLAIEAEGGLALVSSIVIESFRRSIRPIMRPIVEGMRRVYGPGPEVLFSRMQLMAEAASRGTRFDYQPRGPRAGTMVIRVQGSPNVPLALFTGFSISVVELFDICGVSSGTMTAPRMAPEPPDSVARVDVAW